MKIVRSFGVVMLSGSLLTACSKQESSPPPAQVPAKAASQQPAAPATTSAPAAVAPAAQPAASSTVATAQGMIDKAKSLMADNKYSEAMDLLKKLSSMQLTPEQKKMVDDLTAQVQKAVAGAAASDATKSVGGLLGGNK